MSKPLDKGRPTVNRSELAVVFGVSVVTVDNWMKQGCPMVERGGTGGRSHKFDTAAVFRWRNDLARESMNPDAQSAEELKLRKLRAETELAELELAEAAGIVAPVVDFERALAKQNAVVRQNVMTVPQRVVLSLIGEKDETRFKKVLSDELRLALERAAHDAIELDKAESEDGDE